MTGSLLPGYMIPGADRRQGKLVLVTSPGQRCMNYFFRSESKDVTGEALSHVGASDCFMFWHHVNLPCYRLC